MFTLACFEGIQFPVSKGPGANKRHKRVKPHFHHRRWLKGPLDDAALGELFSIMHHFKKIN